MGRGDGRGEAWGVEGGVLACCPQGWESWQAGCQSTWMMCLTMYLGTGAGENTSSQLAGG